MKRKESISKLKKLFKEKQEQKIKAIPELEQQGYMNKTNVLMVVPKTEQFKELLLNNFEVSKGHKIPTLEYEDRYKTTTGLYGVEYISKVLDFLKVFGEDTISISTNKDYPITFENKHFKIIVAPRIEQ